MAIEIVSFTINSMVVFHCYVAVYQRVTWSFLVHGNGRMGFQPYPHRNYNDS